MRWSEEEAKEKQNVGAHRSGIALRLVPSNNLRKIYGMGLKKRDIER